MSLNNGFPTPVGFALVNGGPAATPIRGVGDVDAGSTLIEVKHVSGDLVTNASVLAEASIVGTGAIQLATTDTSGNWLAVVWKEGS